jgi:hypothetical protein
MFDLIDHRLHLAAVGSRIDHVNLRHSGSVIEARAVLPDPFLRRSLFGLSQTLFQTGLPTKRTATRRRADPHAVLSNACQFDQSLMQHRVVQHLPTTERWYGSLTVKGKIHRL